MTVHDIPTINALLNSLAAVLLFSGWRAIKAGKKDRHRRLMSAAIVASGIFLAFYLYYHFNVVLITKYQGTGILRALYFFILSTHIPLAILILPAIGYAVWQAIQQRFDRHTRVTRWLLPVWMYVSVTGVLVYCMLYIFPQSI
jgi:putative membrane protein